ncbi:MAG: G5 domain-containing protein [Clostridia bacterium]|nr:G5 domain-containing protein [Clostridia bacterium]
MEVSKLHIIKKTLIVLILVLSIVTSGVFLITTQLKTITLDYYGKKQTIKTLAVDVNDFLMQNKLILGENDKVEPSKNTVLANGIDIKVSSGTELAMLDIDNISSTYENPMVARIEEVIENIPFEEEKKNNPSVDRGIENTIQEGKEGQKSTRYIVKYDNGQEIARAQISNEVITKTQNKVIEVGSKLPVITSRGNVIRTTNVDAGFKQYNIKLPVEQQKFAYNLCKQYGIQYELFLAMMYKESGYNPNSYGGSGNPSYGLCQIYVTNHAWLSSALGISDFFNPYDNMTAGAFLLARYINSGYTHVSSQGTDAVEIYGLNSYNMGEGVYNAYCGNNGVQNRAYSTSIRNLRDRLINNGGI